LAGGTIDDSKAWLSKKIAGAVFQLLRVTIDPDQFAGQVSSATTLSNVAGAASSTTLAAANTARLGLFLFNDSNKDCFIKYGTTASVTSFTVKLPPEGHHFIDGPIYNGRVDGIWSSANGFMRVTELTA